MEEKKELRWFGKESNEQKAELLNIINEIKTSAYKKTYHEAIMLTS
jgi:hypothetical protein